MEERQCLEMILSKIDFKIGCDLIPSLILSRQEKVDSCSERARVSLG
jgi:hypothetical protein